jgi:mannose-6-phosphate isomerase-like protein (cupin superfamily)
VSYPLAGEKRHQSGKTFHICPRTDGSSGSDYTRSGRAPFLGTGATLDARVVSGLGFIQVLWQHKNQKEQRAMEKEPKLFKYERPEFDGVKKSMLMCNSDLMRVHVQVVKSGGENNLHTHTGEDAFWFVLNGAVRFYGEGDKVIAELKKTDGILIPRGFKYWFESASDEPLEIIRVAARDQNVENKRVSEAPLKPWMVESNRFDS